MGGFDYFSIFEEVERNSLEIKEMGCAWGKENSKQRILSTNKSKVKVKV